MMSINGLALCPVAHVTKIAPMPEYEACQLKKLYLHLLYASGTALIELRGCRSKNALTILERDLEGLP